MQTTRGSMAIRTLVRVRPLSEDDYERSARMGVALTPCVEVRDAHTVAMMQPHRDPRRTQTLLTAAVDAAVPPDATQEEMFLETGGLINHLFEGFNASVIAYGQTGSGKTYTMTGPQDCPPHQQGLIPRLMRDLFHAIDTDDSGSVFELSVSYLELYQERVIDLLNPECEEPFTHLRRRQPGEWSREPRFKEDTEEHREERKRQRLEQKRFDIVEGEGTGVWIRDAVEEPVTCLEDVQALLSRGSAKRHVARTSMNLESSRSHSIFLLTLRRRDPFLQMDTVAQLYMVDLAGSEKVAKTGAQGDRLVESQSINRSLLAFEMVIKALAENSTHGSSGKRQRPHSAPPGGRSRTSLVHVPYRDSKLTRLLQGCLGGNAMTTIVVCVSPAQYNGEESLRALRFARRVSLIRQDVSRNAFRSVEQLEALLKAKEAECAEKDRIIAELRACLDNGTAITTTAATSPSVASPAVAPRRETPARARRSPSLQVAETDAHRPQAKLAPSLSCPLTQRLFVNPVVAADGITYERSALAEWLEARGPVSPMTNRTLVSHVRAQAPEVSAEEANVIACTLRPNLALAKAVRAAFPSGAAPVSAIPGMLAPRRAADYDYAPGLDLPVELIDHVFSFLDLPTLGTAACVCKHWQAIADNHPSWRRALETRFPDCATRKVRVRSSLSRRSPSRRPSPERATSVRLIGRAAKKAYLGALRGAGESLAADRVLGPADGDGEEGGALLSDQPRVGGKKVRGFKGVRLLL